MNYAKQHPLPGSIVSGEGVMHEAGAAITQSESGFLALSYRLISLLLFRAILDLSYSFVISEEFAGEGMGLYSNPLKVGESYFVLFLLALLMPVKHRSFSYLGAQLLFLFAYIPIQTYYAHNDASRWWFYACTAFWVCAFLLVRTPFRISVPATRTSRDLIMIASLFALIAVAFWVRSVVGWSFSLGLEGVYDQREVFGASGEGALYYLVPWCAKVLVPLLLLQAVSRRRAVDYLVFAVALLFGLFFFMSAGEKNFLFRIPAALLMVWLISGRFFLERLSLVLCVVVALSLGAYFVLDDLWLSNLFSRRIFMIPALISFHYYDFFMDRPLMLAGTRLGAIFGEYPYHLPTPHLIGYYYFGSSEAGANNGIMADGYMNFGTFGLLLWAVGLVALLKLGDAVARGKDRIIS
ncbi:MAG: hypothetical protein J5J00_14385, partial [Deltaproteobacteria bacterium]|nr:hypothetical protein [Deltaproteobacteria bacterium]